MSAGSQGGSVVTRSLSCEVAFFKPKAFHPTVWGQPRSGVTPGWNVGKQLPRRGCTGRRSFCGTLSGTSLTWSDPGVAPLRGAVETNPRVAAMSRWFIASSATEVLASGSTLNDRRRGRAEHYWLEAYATETATRQFGTDRALEVIQISRNGM